MFHFSKTRGFRVVAAVLCLIFLGMILSAYNGRGESAQSTVIGTIFTPAQKLAASVNDVIDQLVGNVSGKSSYQEEIDSLRDQVEEMQEQLVDYENLQRQNALYREFLELKEENSDYEFVESKIIARDSLDPYYSFTLDKGTLDDVNVNDPVLYGKYLVGIVVKAYPNYSIVRTILDEQFNASAYEIVTEESGYLSGTPELARHGQCKLTSLDASSDITEGAIICTLGIGGVFPKDLIVGTVAQVGSEETDISNYAVIEPGVDIRDLSRVFVLTDFDGQGEVAQYDTQP
ncbi:MAG: rod shape-determining protein MreC [Clostridiales bacterium]|nr:rod shape-determining protein MreC [Clostridiales bacterium]